MILGFTGTRRQPSSPQIEWLRAYLNVYAETSETELHHGACIGADAFAHMISLRAEIAVVVHPPVKQDFVYQRAITAHRAPHRVSLLPPKPYLDRNRDIVDACDRLIGLPDGPPRRGSGTWYTLTYAGSVERPVTICWPDGAVETR